MMLTTDGPRMYILSPMKKLVASNRWRQLTDGRGKYVLSPVRIVWVFNFRFWPCRPETWLVTNSCQ